MELHIFQVAQFLRVNPDTGLFFFDSSYRPVPLAQQYIGISERDYTKRSELFNTLCYEKVFSLWIAWFSCFLHLYLHMTLTSNWQVVESIKQGHQALVFVHTRKDTGKTARTLVSLIPSMWEALRNCSIVVELQYWFPIVHCLCHVSRVLLFIRILMPCEQGCSLVGHRSLCKFNHLSHFQRDAHGCRHVF